MERCRDCAHCHGDRCKAPLPWWFGTLDALPCDLDNTVEPKVANNCQVFKLSGLAKCDGCRGIGKRYIGLRGWPADEHECWDCNGTGRKR